MLGLVQMPLHSYAEPNWWITSGKRAASESLWYSSFSLVRQKRLVHQKFKLNLGLTQGILSESDVTLVLLQSRTYSVRFSTWNVWHLNQALVTHCVHKEKYYVYTYQWFAPRIGSWGVGIWLIMEIQGWGNWYLKTWKCQISRGLPPFYHILGQTLPRIVQTFSFEDENNYRDEIWLKDL